MKNNLGKKLGKIDELDQTHYFGYDIVLTPSSSTGICVRGRWTDWALARVARRLRSGDVVTVTWGHVGKVGCETWLGMVKRKSKTTPSVDYGLEIGVQPFPPKWGSYRVERLAVHRESRHPCWLLNRVRRFARCGLFVRYTFARNGLRRTWHGVVTHERQDGTVLVRWTEFPSFDLLFPAPACAHDTPISIWIQRAAPVLKSKAAGPKSVYGDVGSAVGHRTPAKKQKNVLEKVLLTWNCRSARAAWRCRELEVSLLRRGVDVACLQETRWRVIPIFKEFVVAASSSCDARGKGGIAILVHRRFAVGDVATGNAGSLLAVTVGEGKCGVRVIGAHAPHSAIEAGVRQAWWKSAAEFWIANRGRGIPTIGLGDFNATLPHVNAERTLAQKENNGSEDLDVFLHTLGLVAANGIFSKPQRRLVTFVVPKMRLAQLDAVLVPYSWRSSVLDVRNSPMPFPSDHVPLEVRVRAKFAVKKCEAAAAGPKRRVEVDYSALCTDTPQVLPVECLWLEAVARGPSGMTPFVTMLNVTAAEVFTNRVKESIGRDAPQLALSPECLWLEAQVGWLGGMSPFLPMLEWKDLSRSKYSAFVASVAASLDAIPVRAVENNKNQKTKGPYEELRGELRGIWDLKGRFDALKQSYDDEEDARVKKCVEDFVHLGKVRPAEAWKAIDALVGAAKRCSTPFKSTPAEIVENFRKVNGLPNHARPPDFRKRVDVNKVDVRAFRMAELDTAVGQLRLGRSFGIDGVPAEVLRLSGFRELMLHFAIDYQKGDVSPELLVTRLQLVPKKGDLSVVENYRPIAIISVFLKLINRMLLNRLKVLDPLLRRGQNGFRDGRGTTEHAMALRILAERAVQRGLKLCTLFIDSQKAFDSVTFASLRASLASFMVPTEFIDVVMRCYNGHVQRVPMPDGSYESYTMTTGVLQGDTLAPFLFVLLLDSILTEAMDPSLGIPTDGGPSIHPSTHGMRLRTGIKLRPVDDDRFLCEMAFADDLAFMTVTAAAAEKQLHAFERIALQCGLKINAAKGKTEVVMVNVVGSIRSLVTDAVIQCVEKYTYLGTDPFDTEGQFHQRKGKAWGAIKKLDTFWANKGIGVRVKSQLFQTIVETVFTYGAVCWPTCVLWRDKIDRAYTAMLRYCLKTGEEEYDLYDQGALAHLSSKITYHRLMTVGHAMRHDQVLGRVLLSKYALPREGRELTLEKQLERDFEEPDRDCWPEMVRDRVAWRQRAREVAALNEERIYEKLLKGKRRRWCDVRRVDARVTLALLECAPVPRQWGPAPRRYVWWGHGTERRQHWEKGKWRAVAQPAEQSYLPAVPYQHHLLRPYRIKPRQHAFADGLHHATTTCAT